MSSKFSFGKLQFDVSLGAAAAGARRDPESPFRLAVVGDLSGRANRGQAEPIAQRRVWKVDCDNFQEVINRLEVRLKLPGHGELRFTSLDDFHPDRLLKQAPALAGLLKYHAQLKSPATAGAAAAELRKLASTPAAAPAPQPSTAPAESSDQTLARLLGGTPAQAAAPSQPHPSTAVEQLLRQAVASSIVPGASAEQSALLAWVELELATQLRSILHHPDFQRLEAGWRGVDLLVRNFGGEEQIKICLLDLSLDELAADLRAQENLEATGLGKVLRRETDDQPWAAWLGLYTFGNRVSELELLGRLAKLAAVAGAPFLSAASPNLVGCDSFASHPDPADWTQPASAEFDEAWRALRTLPEAGYLGLALPRFLLRQPYGKESDPIDAFPFEELLPDAPHESYLWGNPGVACAQLLVAAFQADGWEMQPGGYGEIEELPVHHYEADGETLVKPCAEAWLSDRAGERILGAGLIPLLSLKGRDAVRVANLQSIQESPTGLAGRWG
jgi:type VI secretion system protein ImpC